MRLLIFIGVFAFLSYVSTLILSEERDARGAMYCAAVDAYHATDGQYGWPPYRGPCEPWPR